MNKDNINSFLDLGSTKLRFASINSKISKAIFSDEEKCKNNLDAKKILIQDSENILDKLIKTAEKKIGTHLNDLNVLVDSKDIICIDFSIKNNFEGKIIEKSDINFLLHNAKSLIENNYNAYYVAHSIIKKYYFDDEIFYNEPASKTNCNYLALEIKFICIPKSIYIAVDKLLSKNQIKLKNLYCSSYTKSKSYNYHFKDYEMKVFLDIGYKKSILTVFKKDNLFFLNILKLGSANITKDISSILKISENEAEDLKYKLHKSDITFSDKTDSSHSNQMDLLKKVVFARIEEIFNLSFKNLFFFDEIKKKSSILIFTGEGSKILENNSIYLNSLFESFDNIDYFEENPFNICLAGHQLESEVGKIIDIKKTSKNAGFFEKIFKLFSKI